MTEFDDFFSPPKSNAHELSVSELSQAIKGTIESSFGNIRLRGEISGYRGPHSSGHVYFSLKDQNARIDAVIWKGNFNRLKIKPQEGLEIIATGRVSTFPGKSSYQIIIEAIEPAGIGALMALLEERKKKFTSEGLFDVAHKKMIPFLPQSIGVITSPTGAVIRDIIHRIRDRFPVPLYIWPVRVQGDASSLEITAAIEGFNALNKNSPIPKPDVLIVARGGGSVEDLWSFNEENVIRAAFSSFIPIISAVGHETDWTLLDYVADLRAPTPTGAAEMVVPVRSELIIIGKNLSARMNESLYRYLQIKHTELISTLRAFPRKDNFFSAQIQHLDLLTIRLKPVFQKKIQNLKEYLHEYSQKLAHLGPKEQLSSLKARLGGIERRPKEALLRKIDNNFNELKYQVNQLRNNQKALLKLEQQKNLFLLQKLKSNSDMLDKHMKEIFLQNRNRLHTALQLFENMNYKSVLKRGYALLRNSENKKPIHSLSEIQSSIILDIEISDGEFQAIPMSEKKSDKSKNALHKKKSQSSDQGSLF